MFVLSRRSLFKAMHIAEENLYGSIHKFNIHGKKSYENFPKWFQLHKFHVIVFWTVLYVYWSIF